MATPTNAEVILTNGTPLVLALGRLRRQLDASGVVADWTAERHGHPRTRTEKRRAKNKRAAMRRVRKALKWQAHLAARERQGEQIGL